MDEFKHVEVNGFDICYQETGSGERPLLVLHTLRTQIEYTQRIVPLLADDYRIIVPDLPGFGRSSKDLSRPYDAVLFVDTVAALIDALELDGLTLLGESIGGTIALCLTTERADRIDRVFAFNPHDSDGAIIGGSLGSMLSSLGRHSALPFRLESAALLRLICLAAFAHEENLSNEFVVQLRRVPGRDRRFPKVMQSMMQHAGTWSQLADEKYSRIPASVPVTVVYGDRDWSPPGALDRNRQRLPAHTEYALLERTGHWSFLDNPEGVADVVTDAVDSAG